MNGDLDGSSSESFYYFFSNIAIAKTGRQEKLLLIAREHY